MDFITELPPLDGYPVIVVLIDHFSKAPHINMISSNFTDFKATELFATMVCKKHVPKKHYVS